MLFEEKQFNDGFVLVLILLTRFNLLQKLSSLTAILSNKTRSISNEKFPTFIPELSSRNMSVVIILIQLCKYFLQSACHQIVHSDIIGCE